MRGGCFGWEIELGRRALHMACIAHAVHCTCAAASFAFAKKEPPERGRFEELLDVRVAVFLSCPRNAIEFAGGFSPVRLMQRKWQICPSDDVS
jgi:hypothetical protein